MKSHTIERYDYYAYRRGTPAKYPNSQKSLTSLGNWIVDALLAAAISLGFVVVVMFLLIL